MIDLFISIFGEYQPLVDSVTGEPLEGIACINFTYLLTVLMFIIFVMFVLRAMLIFLKEVVKL